MDIIEKKISNFIESQFPAYYRESGPVLVAFMVEYYKWMESEGRELYYSRRLLENNDIDGTVDDFIIYFKEKYLKDVQFETTSNIRQLIKHTLDLYRSKGTERSIDLLFRLVFGVGAEIYYPASDIFRLSDGKYRVPRYLEVTLNENNVRFVNKQLVGVTSGATAFVEKVIRRTVADRFIDVLYVSAIKGQFVTGEVVIVKGDSVLQNERIRITGSLTGVDIDVNGVGLGYRIGEIVDLYSVKGRQGKGRITSVQDVSGLVNFTLESGGYGYNANAEILISEKVLKISNVNIDINNETKNYFKIFETITQPLANIEYISLVGANNFTVGANIFTYDAGNVLTGSGVILDTLETSNTSGEIKVAVLTGNIEGQRIYTTGNVVYANQSVYTDRTATANVNGIDDTIILSFSDLSGSFFRGEQVYQLNSNNDTEIANGTIQNFDISVGSNGAIRVINSSGVFKNGLKLRSRSTNSTVNVRSSALNIGVFDINNAFTAEQGNYIYSSNTLSNGYVSVVSQGTGATFEISNDVIYTETLYDVATDFIKDYANVALSPNPYGFPGNTAANLVYGTIGDALTIGNIDIGKIRALVSVARGTDYSIAPFVLIYQPEIYHYRVQDSILSINNLSGNFAVGELVTQESTGARGIIKELSNSSLMYVERLRFNDANNFAVTTNTESKIVGSSSGFTANVSLVANDANSSFLGFNASILANTISGNGSVTGMEVVDSGFGFVDGESVFFENGEGISSGLASVLKQGSGRGFFQQKGGFLSDQKKLHDGNYYQEYSYEVRASVTLDKYSEMLKRILHVSGTKFFGALIYRTVANSQVNISSFSVTKTVPETVITELSTLLVTETGNAIGTES